MVSRRSLLRRARASETGLFDHALAVGVMVPEWVCQGVWLVTYNGSALLDAFTNIRLHNIWRQ